MNGTTPAMVPMFLTCATDSTLTKWEGHRALLSLPALLLLLALWYRS
jgi:hypothetical protein